MKLVSNGRFYLSVSTASGLPVVALVVAYFLATLLPVLIPSLQKVSFLAFFGLLPPTLIRLPDFIGSLGVPLNHFLHFFA